MNESPFQKFVALVSFDQTILEAEKTIFALKQELEDLKKQEQSYTDRLAKLTTYVVDARKAVDSIELDIKSSDNNERSKKERLENATDYKQYQSLKAELEHIKTKQLALEDSLIEAWNHLESTQKDLETAKKEIALKQEEIKQNMDQKSEKKESVEKTLAQLSADRHDKEKVVPQEWLEKYSMMRSRVANPVVSIDRGACGACFYNITEQDLTQLRRNVMLQCKGCFRLLYSEEILKEAQKSA